MQERWKDFKKHIKKKFKKYAPFLLKYGVPIVLGSITGGVGLVALIPAAVTDIKKIVKIPKELDNVIDDPLKKLIENYDENAFQKLRRFLEEEALELIRDLASKIQELRLEIEVNQNNFKELFEGWADEFGMEMAAKFEITHKIISDMRASIMVELYDIKKYTSLTLVFLFEILNILRPSNPVTIQELAKKFDKLDIHAGREKLLTQMSMEVKQVFKQNEDRLVSDKELNKIKKNTINSIFSNAIYKILKEKGPLKTEELYDFIRTEHPELCDNSTKEADLSWKHSVRGAQQFLRKKKKIFRNREEKWQIKQKK